MEVDVRNVDVVQLPMAMARHPLYPVGSCGRRPAPAWLVGG